EGAAGRSGRLGVGSAVVVSSQRGHKRPCRPFPAPPGPVDSEAMPSLGPMEIMVILVVALLVLGPKKLPEAGRQVGKAMAEFRRWSNEIQGEMRSAVSTDVGPDY